MRPSRRSSSTNNLNIYYFIKWMFPSDAARVLLGIGLLSINCQSIWDSIQHCAISNSIYMVSSYLPVTFKVTMDHK